MEAIRTKVVYDYVDNLVSVQNERMRKLSVHYWVCGSLSGTHDGVQCGHFRFDPSDIVEEGTENGLVMIPIGERNQINGMLNEI